MGLCFSLCRHPEIHSYSVKDRLTKLALAHHNPLTLIQGYQTQPLVPLEDSLQIFQGKINHLSNQIIEAKQKCLQNSQHGLTRDESAALYLYSMGNDTDSVYAHLQNAWNSNDPYEMKPWLKYIRLLYQGVEKLPNVKGKVWQGTAYSHGQLSDLSSKQKKSYTVMGSAATSIDEVKSYLTEIHVDKGIFIAYDRVDGKNVSGYTAPNFPSVLLYPGMKINAYNHAQQLSDGSIAFNFTKTIEIPKMKHFICQNIRCINRCRLNHVDHRCSGFLLLHHDFSHRCAPKHLCGHCKKKLPDEIYQCKKCDFNFCEKCCMK